MRWPIRNQILMPVALLLTLAVTLIAVSSAILAARRSEEQTLRHLRQVVGALGQASFPFNQNVLEKMRGLSGAEFVVKSEKSAITAATLPNSDELNSDLQSIPTTEELVSLGKYPAVTVLSQRYLVSAVRGPNDLGRTTLIVLYPELSLKQARWEAAVPPLAVGAATILLMVVLSAWLAQHLSLRIRSVQQQVAQIAQGRFQEVDAGHRHDEIRDLATSVNEMCGQLRQMQQTIRVAERSRLLGQLAGGLAHQLRNAVTGARLAVQIHAKRCHPANSDKSGADSHKQPDDSLKVALQQLALTEEQIKGFLSLGRQERRPPEACHIDAVLAEIASLVQASCEHSQVQFQYHVQADIPAIQADRQGLRGALLNLTLNAIEAAGPSGQVRLNATCSEGTIEIEIRDNGAGLPEELADTLGEPFVTGKPEGVGLGLALARQVAGDHGGQLIWGREANWTYFRLRLPQSACAPRV
ncbi:MAG: signal transduction histidine kinase [Planctomycetaceae bacterium]|nr:signal transduction histidine kinase [Planctomycetaceae bacterium]